MVILILDTKNHVLKQHTAYIGSLNTAVAARWRVVPRAPFASTPPRSPRSAQPPLQ